MPSNPPWPETESPLLCTQRNQPAYILVVGEGVPLISVYSIQAGLLPSIGPPSAQPTILTAVAEAPDGERNRMRRFGAVAPTPHHIIIPGALGAIRWLGIGSQATRKMHARAGGSLCDYGPFNWVSFRVCRRFGLSRCVLFSAPVVQGWSSRDSRV